jgi:membrane protease YdiL (CAAX protease family)
MNSQETNSLPESEKGIGCYVILGFIFVSIIAGIAGYALRNVLGESDTTSILSELLFIVFMTLVVIVVMYGFSISPRLLMGSWKSLTSSLYLLAGVLILILTSVATALLTLMVSGYLSPAYFDAFLAQGTFVEPIESSFIIKVILLLNLILFGPILEEFVFRGLLLRYWASIWGVTFALFITSAIFAILHPNIIGAFILGLVYGLIYIKTGSLLLVIAMHVLNNIIALFVISNLTKIFKIHSHELLMSQITLVLVLSLIAFGLLTIFIKHVLKLRNSSVNFQKKLD